MQIKTEDVGGGWKRVSCNGETLHCVKRMRVGHLGLMYASDTFAGRWWDMRAVKDHAKKYFQKD